MSALVLACDVTTKWGVYAHGTPVDVVESSDNGLVIVLADLPRYRLLANVPREVVRRAASVPPRTPRAPHRAMPAAVVAAAWSETSVKEAS